AEDGRVGIDRLRVYRPALVLCDLMMPEVDGYGVLEVLRADPATATIPFVFITASAEKAEIEHGLTRGASAYVTKPFNLDELVSVIRRLLPSAR
ncbi:MAG: response regulator, partial [Betaproteobacteria bacterium]